MDQPFGLLAKMTACLNVYDVCKAWSRNSTNKAWLKENTESAKMINWIAQLEKNG